MSCLPVNMIALYQPLRQSVKRRVVGARCGKVPATALKTEHLPDLCPSEMACLTAEATPDQGT